VTRSLRGQRAKRAAAGSVLLAVCSLLIGLWLALGSGHMEQGLRQSLGLEPYEYDRAARTYTVYTRSGADAEALERYANGEMSDSAQREYGSNLWAEADQYRSLRQNPLPTILAMANTDDASLTRGQRFDAQAARTFIAEHPATFAVEHLESVPMYAPAAEVVAVPDVASGDATPEFDAVDDQSAYDPRQYRDDSVWDSSDLIDQAQIAMAHELSPSAEPYVSPLGSRQAIGLIGLVAGGLWTILLLVVAPVAVGAQQAQERHENTLMPLTATSLNSRELVLGLMSGPAVVIGFMALPQLALALSCAALLGFALPMVFAGAVLTIIMAIPMMFAGQLLGQIAGRRHAPGLVTFGLLAVFAPLWFVGLSLANTAGMASIDGDLVRIVAIIPTAGPLTWIERAFVAAAYDTELGAVSSRGGAFDLDALRVAITATVVAAGAALGAAALLLRALERHVTGHDGPTLTRLETYAGAGLALAVYGWTVPLRAFNLTGGGLEPTEFYLATLAMLAPSLLVLVMARVPLLSAPGLRELPLRRILSDVGVWFGVHLAIVTGLGLALDAELLGSWNPVSLLYLAWVVVTLTLLGLRMVAFPLGIAGVAWAMLITFMGGVAYVHILAFSEGNGPRVSHPLALAELSPALGVLQAALLVAVPLVSWRRLGQRCKIV